MKTQFVSTKLRTTDDVDWTGSLKVYLTKLYGNVTDFSKEVNIINKLRSDVMNSINDEDNYETTKNLYYKYYGQLELLDLRLPFEEHGVKIKFKWYDAYDNAINYTQHSLAFEKASVLFNLASVLSKLADSKFHDEDYAKSYQYFQYSSGIYKFISENFLHAPSNDLNVKTVQFLTNLQLAQAQEVFLLKLVREDSSKQSLISRLSMAASQQYDKTQTSLEKIDDYYGDANSWNQILKFKTRFYLGLSYYYYGLSIEDKKFGISIAVLKLALEKFKDLKKYENPTSINYLDYFTLTDDKLRLLIKDNDFIYHDTVPSKESLEIESLIKALDASKSIPLNEHANITEIIGEDIFEKIIPNGVHEKLSLYSEEKAKLLREQLDNIEMVNIELQSFLEYLRLPQSLNDFKNTNANKLDPKLIDWSNTIIESNLNDIDENKLKINNKKEEILKLIKNLDSKLIQEEEDFNAKRYELNSLQEPSTLQSASLKDELTNAKQSLLSAAKLDSQINAKIEPELKRLNILKSKQDLEFEFFNNSKQDENLLDFYDNDESGSFDKVSLSINKIEEDLKILRNLKKERENILEELKTAIHEDDISNILVLNNKNLNEKEEKALFKQELTKFDSFIKKIEVINSKQPEIIKNIKIHYDKIITSNNKISEKAQKIASFETTFNAFKEYEINYGKSIEFYNNLLNFVYEVRTNIDKFVSDRYLQRQRILSQSSSSRNLSQSGSTQSQANSSLQERFNKLSVSSQSPRGSYVDQSNYSSSPVASSPVASSPVRYHSQPQQWQPPASSPYEIPKPQHQPPMYQPLQPTQAPSQPPVQPYQQYQQTPQFQQPQYPPYQAPSPQSGSYDRPALPPKPGSTSYSTYGTPPNPGYSQPYDPNQHYK